MGQNINTIIQRRNKELAELLEKYHQQKNWQSFFITLEGHERQEAFECVYSEMSNEEYWKNLGEIIQGECLYDDKLKNLLTNKQYDLSLRHLMMSESDKQIFNKLPDKVRIYRGASEDNSLEGWSWSLSEKVALFFGKRFNKSVVLTGVCDKKDVIAYFHDRNEQELVIPFKEVNNVRVIQKLINKHITSTDSVIFKKRLDLLLKS